ncbi:hypothetical protein, partial [Escherichia coli]|uniref:hypothetical protein n=1 Tax=Escherichia coli TaxID=562 RepID=UPI001954EB84
MPHDLTRRQLLATAALGTAATASLASPAIAQSSLRGSGSVVVYDGGGSMGHAQLKAYSEPFEAE